MTVVKQIPSNYVYLMIYIYIYIYIQVARVPRLRHNCQEEGSKCIVSLCLLAGCGVALAFQLAVFPLSDSDLLSRGEVRLTQTVWE